jgi:superfamily I DNA/RNA helicase
MKIVNDQRLILGPPGTGKTTRCLSIIEQELADGTAPNRIAYVSFTKKAVEEAVERATTRFNYTATDLPYFRTLHSLCYRLLRLNRTHVMGRANYLELGQMLGYNFSAKGMAVEDGMPTDACAGDKLLFIDGLARNRLVTLEQQWHDVNDPDIDLFALKRLRDSLQSYKAYNGLYDYTDMLEQAVKERVAVGVDVVVIDEAQDLTCLQWAVCRVLFRNAKRVYVAGDDDQCQPAETMVETTTGKKCIAELDETTDRLLSYSQTDAEIYGKRNGGYAFKKASREYSGFMYTLQAGEKASRSTHNHRWLVKWRPEIKQRGICVTYIMQRGNWWRVGWCQLFRQDGCFHLNVRANIEKADKVWIVGAHHNRTDASIDESIIAAKYGIPTIPFEPVDRALHITTEAIKRIFDGVPNAGVAALGVFADRGYDVKYPFIDRTTPNYSRYGSTILDVRACNLINGLMLAPVYHGTKQPTWMPLSIDRIRWRGMVYSLAVDKYETYIADGIITHNCIFRWSGADVEQFLQLAGEREVLGTSYRLPRSVHQLACSVIGRVKHRFDKTWAPRDEAGSVERLPHISSVDFTTEGTTLVLARNAYLLNEAEEMLRKAGQIYTTRHGDSSINADHYAAIRAWEQLRKGAAISGSNVESVYAHLRVGTGIKRGFKSSLGSIDSSGTYTMAELRDHCGLIADGIWHDALDGIALNTREYYVSVMRAGAKLSAAPRIRISTIHAAKGGEADNVVLLTDMSQRTYRGYQADPDDEQRVFYVGMTRAKKRLTVIDSRNGMGFIAA